MKEKVDKKRKTLKKGPYKQTKGDSNE